MILNTFQFQNPESEKQGSTCCQAQAGLEWPCAATRAERCQAGSLMHGQQMWPPWLPGVPHQHAGASPQGMPGICGSALALFQPNLPEVYAANAAINTVLHITTHGQKSLSAECDTCNTNEPCRQGTLSHKTNSVHTRSTSRLYSWTEPSRQAPPQPSMRTRSRRAASGSSHAKSAAVPGSNASHSPPTSRCWKRTRTRSHLHKRSVSDASFVI